METIGDRQERVARRHEENMQSVPNAVKVGFLPFLLKGTIVSAASVGLDCFLAFAIVPFGTSFHNGYSFSA